jgi:hypothetical protein
MRVLPSGEGRRVPQDPIVWDMKRRCTAHPLKRLGYALRGHLAPFLVQLGTNERL